MNDAYRLLTRAAAVAEAGELSALEAALKCAEKISFEEPLLLGNFLSGFRARLSATKASNLYLRTEDVQQIDLYTVLNKHLPLLRAKRIANDILLPFLNGHTEATVLALGIGRGGQECDLLARAPHLRSLTVIGVDVAAESLSTAGEALRAAGRKWGIDVGYRPVMTATENLNEALWDDLRALPRPLLVAASFALHHMRDTADGQDTRTLLFRRLKNLEPAAVALCEPDANHHLAPLSARLASAWHHYGTLFSAINATRASEPEKTAMKQFFGREIQNVIGATDEDRYERHEPTAVWLDRFTTNGFRLHSPTLLHTDTEPGFTNIVYPTHVELSFESVPLAAVITAVPR